MSLRKSFYQSWTNAHLKEWREPSLASASLEEIIRSVQSAYSAGSSIKDEVRKHSKAFPAAAQTHQRRALLKCLTKQDKHSLGAGSFFLSGALVDQEFRQQLRAYLLAQEEDGYHITVCFDWLNEHDYINTCPRMQTLFRECCEVCVTPWRAEVAGTVEEQLAEKLDRTFERFLNRRYEVKPVKGLAFESEDVVE